MINDLLTMLKIDTLMDSIGPHYLYFCISFFPVKIICFFITSWISYVATMTSKVLSELSLCVSVFVCVCMCV